MLCVNVVDGTGLCFMGVYGDCYNRWCTGLVWLVVECPVLFQTQRSCSENPIFQVSESQEKQKVWWVFLGTTKGHCPGKWSSALHTFKSFAVLHTPMRRAKPIPAVRSQIRSPSCLVFRYAVQLPLPSGVLLSLLDTEYSPASSHPFINLMYWGYKVMHRRGIEIMTAKR